MANVYTKNYQKFVKLLRKARHEAGLSQVEVAKKLNKPQTYVSKCELAERRVDVTELKLFAKIYKKSVNYFLD